MFKFTFFGTFVVYIFIWHDNLLIGTNQGIYYTRHDKLNDLDMFSSLKLIEGTQGQVWSFRKIDGRLFCAHTNGLLEILPDLHIRHPYRINTGVFRTLEATINGKQIQIIITYDELLILNRTTGELNSMRQIADPIYNAEVDHLGNIWLETSSRGVYKCRLNDEQSAFRYYTYYGNEKDSSLPARLQLFKSGGRILFLGNDQFYIYDEVNDNLQLEQHLNRCFETIHDLKRIVPIDSEDIDEALKVACRALDMKSSRILPNKLDSTLEMANRALWMPAGGPMRRIFASWGL